MHRADRGGRYRGREILRGEEGDWQMVLEVLKADVEVRAGKPLGH
jgi:hypothetical protein